MSATQGALCQPAPMHVAVQMATDGAPLGTPGVACTGARGMRATGLEMRGPRSACTAKRATLRLPLWYALQITWQGAFWQLLLLFALNMQLKRPPGTTHTFGASSVM